MESYQIYLVYLISLSLITFLAYFIDKVKAKAGAWRTKEKTLLTLSLLGGAYGGLLGVFLIRHKSKHPYFRVINIVGAVVHTLGVIAVAIFL